MRPLHSLRQAGISLPSLQGFSTTPERGGVVLRIVAPVGATVDTKDLLVVGGDA